MAKDWASNMRLYIRSCTNLDTLSKDEQRTLCKKFLCPTLWLQVIFLTSDDLDCHAAKRGRKPSVPHKALHGAVIREIELPPRRPRPATGHDRHYPPAAGHLRLP